jgi:phosphoglycerate dehydrogenase-like enzyme
LRIPTILANRREISMSGLKIAILDDYQDVALSLADWSSLNADVEVFTAPFADAEEVVKRLADFDVLVAMRERTRFPADLLSRLRSLKLLVTTGPANAAIDVKAAQENGIGSVAPATSLTRRLSSPGR